jgi:predicted HTH domain antitoxin
MLTQVVAAFSMDFSAAQRRRNKFSCYNYGNKEFPMATTETTFSVQIPSNLLKLGISQNEIQNRVSEWLVFSLFSEGKISSGKAGKLLGISRLDFIQLLKTRGIAFINYSEDEIKEEFEAVKKFTPKAKK